MLVGTAGKLPFPSNTPNMLLDIAPGNTKAISSKRPSQGALCVTCLAGAEAQNEQDREKSWEDCQYLGTGQRTPAFLLPPCLPADIREPSKQSLLYSSFKE